MTKTLKSLVFTVGLLSAAAAAAQGRPDSRTMSCQQVQAFIANQGAVVLTTGRYTYDRYVRNTGQCFSTGEIAVIARIAAADNPACRVYRCEAIDPEDRPFRVPVR
jgi:hypothetical protein